MNEKIDLGIIIPTLNSERYLEHTLVSLRELISVGANVLIVDSYSEDHTLEIARRHGVEFISEPAGNMYRAINRGVENLTNEWVTYINSDDLLYSDSIVDALNQLSSTADLIYGNIDYVDEMGRYLHGWRSPSASNVSSFLRIYNPFPQQGTLFRRSAWAKLEGFDETYRYSSDRDFFTRCSLSDSRVVKYTSNRIAGFRLHGQQFSQTVKEAMEEECQVMSHHWGVRAPGQTRQMYLKSLIRLRNIDSYILRFLRKYQLTGEFILSRTI